MQQVAAVTAYHLPPDSAAYTQTIISGVTGGPYWGLVTGWLVGLAAAIIFGVTNRHQQQSAFSDPDGDTSNIST